jgi:uncharacterized glyoxalase superfamily protein PhnB
MPVLDSYLFFNGNRAEAMRFYERVPGGKARGGPMAEAYCSGRSLPSRT